MRTWEKIRSNGCHLDMSKWFQVLLKLYGRLWLEIYCFQVWWYNYSIYKLHILSRVSVIWLCGWEERPWGLGTEWWPTRGSRDYKNNTVPHSKDFEDEMPENPAQLCCYSGRKTAREKLLARFWSKLYLPFCSLWIRNDL